MRRNTFLAAAMVLAISTTASSQSGSWSKVGVQFDITVDSLSRMRRFARNCGDTSAEELSKRFVEEFVSKAPVDRGEVEHKVEIKFRIQPGYRDKDPCSPEDLVFWSENFRTQWSRLNQMLGEYLRGR